MSSTKKGPIKKKVLLHFLGGKRLQIIGVWIVTEGGWAKYETEDGRALEIQMQNVLYIEEVL